MKRWLIATWCMAGCVGTSVDTPDSDALFVYEGAAGQSINGESIPYTVLGSGTDVSLFIASIHGSEPAGTPLLAEFKRHLLNNAVLLTNRKVILIPNANPDGVQSGTRLNARGVDLNRNFPTTNRRLNLRSGSAALSEPESRAIERMLRRHRPQRIVSIHQPLQCIDYDGPAADLAAAIAAEVRLPVKKLGGRPGSLGSFCEEQGIPIITLELPKQATGLSSKELWRRYGRGLMAAVVYPGPGRMPQRP